MNRDDLPQRWKTRIRDWIQAHSEDAREHLCAYDFPSSHSVQITFEDESRASFNYAIVVEAPDLRELGIFTEHCGYHIFPLGGTHVVRVENQ